MAEAYYPRPYYHYQTRPWQYQQPRKPSKPSKPRTDGYRPYPRGYKQYKFVQPHFVKPRQDSYWEDATPNEYFLQGKQRWEHNHGCHAFGCDCQNTKVR